MGNYQLLITNYQLPRSERSFLMAIAHPVGVQEKTGVQVNGTGLSQTELNPVSPVDLLKPTDTFVNRHLGPRGPEVEQMLAVLGVASLDELIEQTIPQAIRLIEPLKLPEPRSESEVLAELRDLAAQNKLFRSFIGMGYYDCGEPRLVHPIDPLPGRNCPGPIGSVVELSNNGLRPDRHGNCQRLLAGRGDRRRRGHDSL
jgi:hypothetical protein